MLNVDLILCAMKKLLQHLWGAPLRSPPGAAAGESGIERKTTMQQGNLPLRRPVRDTIAAGRGQASRTSAGIMHPEMLHILEEFYSFPSPAARAAFADKWIGNVGKRFEQTWQVFYELLKIVEDQHLYTRAEALEG